jgi:hypothetical protein
MGLIHPFMASDVPERVVRPRIVMTIASWRRPASRELDVCPADPGRPRTVRNRRIGAGPDMRSRYSPPEITMIGVGIGNPEETT